VLKLNIKTTSELNGKKFLAARLGHDYMIRPNETFDHGMSSYGSIIHPFLPIEQDSRSRSRE
jgi:hypothetical protein